MKQEIYTSDESNLYKLQVQMSVLSIPARCWNNSFPERSSICRLSDWHVQEVTSRLSCISRMPKRDTTVFKRKEAIIPILLLSW